MTAQVMTEFCTKCQQNIVDDDNIFSKQIRLQYLFADYVILEYTPSMYIVKYVRVFITTMKQIA
jgi:hypothetical protein